MSFNWTNIISLNGSQNNAFEELLCQLAKKESIENKKEFIKVGNPDGGVECYIVLENGDEIGFQAKWFLSTPQDIQWNQIKESFKTAIEKHPKVIQYYVAIPLDRADPRNGKSHFMDKWNEKTEQWKTFAFDTYKKEIDFVYWGSSELIERLTTEENSGLMKFFFGEVNLSNEWLKKQNELAIKDLGARYTPEINVELEIVENFDALSRNERFKKLFDDYYHDMMVRYREFIQQNYTKDENIEELTTTLKYLIDEFEKEYFEIEFTSNNIIDFEKLLKKIEQIRDISKNIWDYLDELNQKEIEEKKIKTEHGYRASTTFDHSIGKIRNAIGSLNEFREILYKPIVKIANNPYVILDGEAGVGKSHLLADIVKQRLEDGYNSVFLLGQHFMQEKSPWSQILDDILRLQCNEDEFLRALNAKAETEQKRIIIFIDAINEGKGKSFWKEFLVGFVESIKKYEWLGLILSIRSSYTELIIPKTLKNDKSITFIRHYGFEDIEYDATKLFFDYYQIEQPTIPLLHPEFSNPLFLKLFCEGLKKRGLSSIPDGYEGITNIITFFIEGIEENLLKKYPSIKKLHLLDKVLDKLVEEFLKNQILSYDKAYEKIEEIVSKYRLDSGLLDDLVSEGLLTLNNQYDYKAKKHYEVVYIAYERFEDHLKVKYLIDKHIDKNNPKASFESEPLKSLFNEENIWKNRGIIEAMSIQLPEFCGFELIDTLPQNKILIEAFFESFLWRKTESISEQTVKRIMKNIDNKHVKKKIFEILFLTASNPKHPLNAKLMHDYMKNFSMKDRDVWFIPLLNSIYLDYGANPIKRLIDWAWSDSDKSYLSDESIFLTALAMSWLLTTSNRQLRDSATKAMISILQGRINIVKRLLQEFEDIDEPYVYERLFAVAFGVVVRTESNDYLKEFGEYVYQTIFDKDEVYPHILLRDYAKNIIDYIVFLGIDLEVDYEKVKPPYKSYFPSIEELPTNEYLKQYEDRDKNYHNSDIISSMVTEYGQGVGGYGDFGRYVFGYKIDDFVDRKYEQLVSNYATKKIFEEYGYDGEFFNDAEKIIQENNRYIYDRYNHKIERIGKKYQWIAFYDVMARVTDNFKMYEDRWSDEKKKVIYKGAFEPYVRNIDPTILLKETKSNWYIETDNKFWWSAKANFQWGTDNKKWLNETKDIPNPKDSILFQDDEGREWIALASNPHWIQPIKNGIDRSSIVYKQAWYIIHSYLIPNENIDEFKSWAKKQNFGNDWMPRNKGHHQIFNREFYWSTAYSYFQNPYYGFSEWTEIDSYQSNGKYPYKVGLTTAKYYWEEEFDYSKKSSLNMQKPSKILFEGMSMRYSEKEGCFIDENGEVICFDPSIYNESNSYLMVRKDKLTEFLSKNNLTICWTIIGEKQVITPSFGNNGDFGVMQINGYISLDWKGLISIKDAEQVAKNFNTEIRIEEMNTK